MIEQVPSHLLWMASKKYNIWDIKHFRTSHVNAKYGPPYLSQHHMAVPYLLTYSVEQSPSWEADQSLQLVKKLPAFLWNPRVPHHTHKCLPPVPILSQLHPIPMTPSNFLKIHLNIFLPSMSGSTQWPLSLRLPHQHPVHTSWHSHTVDWKAGWYILSV
jgi:hypothetical protein